MRRGLLGGTFDPIHLGHLRAAENARETLSLDDVLFVPTGRPPHREDPQAPALDRYAMVALALAGHARFKPSDLEVVRDGPSYTVETVAEIGRRHPDDEIFLIVGSDTFPEMETWKDRSRLFELCTVAVAGRPGAEQPPPAWAPSARVRRVDGPGLDVSSTLVRGRLKQGASVRYLVPDAVAEYIAKRELYR